MENFIIIAVFIYLGVGAVFGVYAAIRYFRDDAEDPNMLVIYAVVLAVSWPAALGVLIKRRYFSKTGSEPVESDVQKTKTLV